MPAQNERGIVFTISHRQSSSGYTYTGGATQSDEHTLVPGPGYIVVLPAITLIQPNDELPPTAAVGIRSFEPVNEPSQDMGPDPLRWHPSLHRRLGTFVMGFHAVRCTARGWYTITNWA